MATTAAADAGESLLLDREREVGADARQVTVVSPTVIASDATTKNQPPDIDIIMFQIRPGMANGISSCQKLCQARELEVRARLRPDRAGRCASD